MKHHCLSPSSFPAWAQCPAFDSDPTERADAAAGTAGHAALASLLQGHRRLVAELPPDAGEGVEWAAHEIRQRAGQERIEVEVRLHHVAEDGSEIYFGTADAIAGQHLFDFKSGGDERDYTAQLAAYALARLDHDFGLEEVHCHILFGRTRTIRTFTLTRAEAEGIVTPILAARQAPDRKPVPCDWCSYCAHRLSCPALVDRALEVAKVRDWREDVPAMAHPSSVTDPVVMGRALELSKYVEKWTESVRFHALELAKAGAVIPGWRLQERRGQRDVTDLQAAFDRVQLPPAAFMRACKLSLPRLAEVYSEAHGLQRAPAARELDARLGDLIVEGKPSVSLVRERGDKERLIHD